MSGRDEKRSDFEQWMLTRRKFVLGATGVVATASGADAFARTIKAGPFRRAAEASGAEVGLNSHLGLSPLPGASQTYLIARREDFLFVQLDLFNLQVSDGMFSRINTSDAAYLVYSFPGQHIVEQAYVEDEAVAGNNIADYTTGVNTPPPKPGLSNALLAGPSRVAFALEFSGAFTVENLLDWSPTGVGIDPSLVPVVTALPSQQAFSANAGGLARPPFPYETAIEMPWHLVLSTPNNTSVWVTPDGATAENGAYEIWHARYASGPTDPDGYSSNGYPFFPLQAVWNYDWNTSGSDFPPTLYDLSTANGTAGGTSQTDGGVDPNSPFVPNQSLSRYDRWNLVRLTSDNTTVYESSPPAEVPTVPAQAPLNTNRLWLTARGGYLDVEGSWEDKLSGLQAGQLEASTASWRHVITGGRDQYVRIVDRGFLFPWGHRVTLTTVTERAFQSLTGVNAMLAALRQFNFCVTLQTVVDYGGAVDFPFMTLKLLTARTPFIQRVDYPSSKHNLAQLLCLDPNGADPFPFHFSGTDWSGREVAFTAPGIFVPDEATGGQVDTTRLRKVFNGQTVNGIPGVSPDDISRITTFHGQKIAFGNYYKPGDTDLVVQKVTWGAAPQEGTGDVPSFRPTLSLDAGEGPTNAQAIIRLPAAEILSGGGALPGNPTPSFAYHPEYTGFPVTTTTSSTPPAPTPVSGTHGGPAPKPGNGKGETEEIRRRRQRRERRHRGAKEVRPLAAHITPARSPHIASNPAEVFMTNAAIPATSSDPGNLLSGVSPGQIIYGGGASGGLVLPNIDINGLSRMLGPISDPEGLLGGQFDPSSFFPTSGADGALSSLVMGSTFLGGLPLGVLLDAVGVGDLDMSAPQIPVITHTQDTETIVTQVQWNPPFSTPGGAGVLNQWVTPDPTNFQASLTGTITTVLNPTGNSATTTKQFNGSIGPFTFTLLSLDTAPFIAISFESVTFTGGTGQKTSVKPHGIGVEFIGALAFLEQLEDVITQFAAFDGGGSGGVMVTVNSSGVMVELSVQIPPVGLGFFTLSGIGFEGTAIIPLDGFSAATFSFGIASQSNPFTLAAGIFGGGGYFVLTVGTKDLVGMLISLDFGAMMSIDLGVASGGVSLTAGIAYQRGSPIDPSTGKAAEYADGTTVSEGCQLTAFIKLNGYLSILDGIISLNITFDLVLQYSQPDPPQAGVLTGTATLMLELTILFVHPTITMTVTKTLSGSGLSGSQSGSSIRARTTGTGSPLLTWGEQFSQSDWATYASAFEMT